MTKILLALLMTTVASGAAFAAEFAQSKAVDGIVDTGWVCTDNTVNREVTLRHNLGTTPRLANVIFAPNQDSSVVYPLTWSWAAANSGNPVTIALTTENVLVGVYTGVPLHGVWTASNGAWASFNTGCFRAFLIK
jgi:hypothetical protein